MKWILIIFVLLSTSVCWLAFLLYRNWLFTSEDVSQVPTYYAAVRLAVNCRLHCATLIITLTFRPNLFNWKLTHRLLTVQKTVQEKMSFSCFFEFRAVRDRQIVGRGWFRHVQHVWPDRSLKSLKGAPRAIKCMTAAWHFSACESLFMACCDIWKFTWCNTTFPGLYKRLPNSESRISNQKTAYIWSAKFTASFCR